MRDQILIKKRKIIVITIPKVASSSLSGFCSKLNDSKFKPYKDTNIDKIKNFTDKKYKDHFKITFVRNPFDRAVSTYLNKLTGPKKNVDLKHFKPYGFYYKMPFNEYVRILSKIPDREFTNNHIKSQYKFVRDIKLMDFVGRFETIDIDIEYLCNKFKIEDFKLPHLLKSHKRKHYRSYYNPESRKLMAERYSEDLKIFNYKFED